MKGVRLKREMLTRFADMIVRNGNDGSDRLFCARYGVTSENVRVGIVKSIAALAREGQSEDAMVNVKFHSVSVYADGKVLETERGPCN
jgi:hypothetical protein